MERLIVKSALYGFFLTLAMAILFVDYRVAEGPSVTYVPVYDYVMTVLRYSIVGSFIGAVVGWRVYRMRVKKEGKTYYLEVFAAVFILAMAAGLVFSLLGI
ncbi:hypothetical protein JSY36_04835 [Bacillus sp. H-16]|uniref:hypothetical protein n=1 Tax=Alteribacter salitolerans TaxID=2912333 RepID=UPI001965D316|nr:hypothetical protein [Alteribacter salitolerans]MBM7095078.1 hypothetical protein [Alteribacter salitolerans]